MRGTRRSNYKRAIEFRIPHFFGTRVPQTQTLAAAAMRAPTALLLALLCAIAAPLCAAQVSVIELSQIDQGSRCEAFSAANVNCQGVVPVGTLVYLNSSTTQASADAFATTQASTRPTPSIELFVLRGSPQSRIGPLSSSRSHLKHALAPFQKPTPPLRHPPNIRCSPDNRGAQLRFRMRRCALPLDVLAGLPAVPLAELLHLE